MTLRTDRSKPCDSWVTDLAATYGAGIAEECGGSSWPGPLSVCDVDAGGVWAEWVEAAVATSGQATFLYFSSGRSGADALTAGRQLACDLAVATGARTFSVGCRRAPGDPRRPAIEEGVTANAWLLGEGLDLLTSAFITDFAEGCLARAVLVAARDCGLPIPPARDLRLSERNVFCNEGEPST